MRKKPLLLLAAVALVFGASIFIFRYRSTLGLSSPLVVLRYVCATNSSGMAQGPTFWATNRSRHSLAIKLEAIEVQTDQGWSNYCQIPPPNGLWFTNNQMPGILLPPHAVQLGSMLFQRINPPTNAAWRARATVAQQLTGAEASVARFLRTPEAIPPPRRVGSTNNARPKDSSRFGPPVPVVSEAVLP